MAKKPAGKPAKKEKGKKKGVRSLQIVEVLPPGVYHINATDILQTLAMRRRLQASIEKLKVRVRQHKESIGDKVPDEVIQALLDSVQKVDDAVKPIAYGEPCEEPCEDGEE